MSTLAAIKKAKAAAAKKRKKKPLMPMAMQSSTSGPVTSSSPSPASSYVADQSFFTEASYTTDDSDYSEEEEDAEDYKKGGYHPVHIGDKFNEGRYTVLRKLGWGHFSTVWLVMDHKYDRPVALKIVKSATHYSETAMDEIKLLEKVNTANRDAPGREFVVELVDSFKHRGPHGTHVCMGFEVLGPNLLTLIRQYHHRGIPMDIVKRITKQILMGLDYMHRECEIIHTDLKPENVLICIDVTTTLRKHGIQISRSGEHLVRSPSTMDVVEDPAAILDLNATSSSSTLDSIATPTRSHSSHKKPRKDNSASPEDRKEEDGIAGYVKDDDNEDEEGTEGEADEDTTMGNNPELPDMREKSTEALGRNLSDISLTDKQLQKDKEILNIRKEMEGEGPYHHSHNPTHHHHHHASPSSSPGLPSDFIVDEKEWAGLTDKERKKRKREYKRAKRRQRDEKIRVKIADLGNACWVDHHFTNDIQTRQYRSPEAILGAKYDRSADMWSLGCIVFELLTGDYLFDPQPGSKFSKDDDHIAQMVELLGPLPKNFALSGRYSNELFNRKGELRNIHKLKYWKLEDVLHEKYHFSRQDAKEISDFILPMIEIIPERRASAYQMLSHHWVRDVVMESGRNTASFMDSLPRQS